MRAAAFAIGLMIGAAHLGQFAEPSYAQDRDSVKVEAARKRFQEGVRFFDQKRYDEARTAFFQAYALKPHPAVLLNLAQSEVRCGHAADAVRHFSTFLQESTTASPAERAEAEKGLQLARSKTGRTIVSVMPAGAEVFADDEYVGIAPLPEPLDLDPGVHSIEARSGGTKATASVTIQVGKTTTTSLWLEGKAAAPLATTPPPPPPAQTAATPPPPPSPPESTPAEPEKAAEKATEPTAPLVTEEAARPVPEGREAFFPWLGHSAVGWTGVGMTAVGLGLTAFATVRYYQHADKVTQIANEIRDYSKIPGNAPPDGRGACQPPIGDHYALACSQLRSKMDSRDASQTLIVVGAITAGVGLAVVGIGYAVGSERPASQTSRAPALVPVVTPGYAGLTLGSAF